jgi:cytochrome b pre-mRNA-processing protein 3
MLRRSRKADRPAEAARNLYTAIMARAREPIFYADFAVADTIDGRFDLLALHAALVMEALPPGARLASDLATEIFAGFDEALRELGVGDFGLSRRMKALADAFYGRLQAYRAAQTEAELVTALIRNLYRGTNNRGREAGALAHYIVSVRQRFRQDRAPLLEGNADLVHCPA